MELAAGLPLLSMAGLNVVESTRLKMAPSTIPLCARMSPNIYFGMAYI